MEKSNQAEIADLRRYLYFFHYGQGNEITAARLAEALQVGGRKLRQIAHDARIAGVLVCTNDKGYYYPANLEDAERTYARIASRTNETRKTLAGFTRGLQREFGQESLFDLVTLNDPIGDASEIGALDAGR